MNYSVIKSISTFIAVVAVMLGTASAAQAQTTNGNTTYYIYGFAQGQLGNGTFQLGNGVNIPENWCALSGYGTFLDSNVSNYIDSISLGHGGANNTYNVTATNVLLGNSNDMTLVEFSCTPYSNFTTAQSSNWYSNTTTSETGPFPSSSPPGGGGYTSANILNATGPNEEGDQNYACYLMGMSALSWAAISDWSTVTLPCDAYEGTWDQVGTGAGYWSRETWATCTQFSGNNGYSIPNYQTFSINYNTTSIALPSTTQAFCALTEIQGGNALVSFGANDTQTLEYWTVMPGYPAEPDFTAEATCWYFNEAATMCPCCWFYDTCNTINCSFN
jgi:hypothetical protein